MIGDPLRPVRIVAIDLREIGVVVGDLHVSGDVLVDQNVIQSLSVAVEDIGVLRRQNEIDEVGIDEIGAGHGNLRRGRRRPLDAVHAVDIAVVDAKGVVVGAEVFVDGGRRRAQLALGSRPRRRPAGPE